MTIAQLYTGKVKAMLSDDTVCVKQAVWAGDGAALLALGDDDTWLPAWAEQFRTLTGQRPGPLQVGAWRDALVVLQTAIAALPVAAGWQFIFEYMLPREGGRRADVVVLFGRTVAVLEFKQASRPGRAACDQALAYARDLAAYHAASHERAVLPVLVLTRASGLFPGGDLPICGADALAETLAALPGASQPVSADDRDTWLMSEYAPLPGIVQAARQTFAHEPLPAIRRAQSAGIPATLAYLAALVQQARTTGERHVVLLTGVPGAGKTLVGLQFVYGQGGEGERPDAVMLSGNGMLVTVLQYALKSRTFVQQIRNFFLHYRERPHLAPPEHVLVFDEAQRAWDPERMGEKHTVSRTAQQHLLDIAERIPGWSVVLALIGEGQEIHIGEEGGLPQWDASLRGMAAGWQVHCAPRLAPAFGPDIALHTSPTLDLTASLRTHTAEGVQQWVAALLAADRERAAELAARVREQGFVLACTRDLSAAVAYCRERYHDAPDKRYGILASSRAGNLPRFGIANDYQTTRRLKVGPWYIDSPESPLSCCRCETVATEFACQGLELDMPIVGWGSDLIWRDGAWHSPPAPRSKARNPHQLRVNSYRVLLSRGRDGCVVFVPPEARMDATAEALLAAGMQPLDTSGEKGTDDA